MPAGRRVEFTKVELPNGILQISARAAKHVEGESRQELCFASRCNVIAGIKCLNFFWHRSHNIALIEKTILFPQFFFRHPFHIAIITGEFID